MKTLSERRAESARALEQQRFAQGLAELARKQRREAIRKAATFEELRDAVADWIEGEA